MAFAQEIRVSRKDWWPLMKETELALTILVATIYDVHYLGIQVTCYPLTGHWWENLTKNAQIKCLFLFKSTSKQKENIDSLETVRHIPMEEDVTPRLIHFCSYSIIATKVENPPPPLPCQKCRHRANSCTGCQHKCWVTLQALGIGYLSNQHNLYTFLESKWPSE